jgi:hypothetical protein
MNSDDTQRDKRLFPLAITGEGLERLRDTMLEAA